MTTTEKALFLIKLKSRIWLIDLLGITYPTLQNRLSGKYEWSRSEDAVIDSKWKLAEPAKQLIESSLKTEKEVDKIKGRL